MTTREKDGSLDPSLERIRELLERREEEAPGGGGPSNPRRREGVTAGDAPRPDAPAPADEIRDAAVTLVLRPGEEVELLLIKRARSERDPWSGHMALPGGRWEPGDESLVETAVRETAEETGVDLRSNGTRLGRLGVVAPMSRRLPRLVITPYVFAVPRGTVAEPRPGEVDEVFWVPLSLFLDPVRSRVALMDVTGGPRPFPAFQVGTEVVWGLTHRILSDFLPVIEALHGDDRGKEDG